MVTGLAPLLRRLGGVGAWELCRAWRHSEGTVEVLKVLPGPGVREKCRAWWDRALCSCMEGLRKG